MSGCDKCSFKPNFFYSCINTRALESRPGARGRSISLRAETLGMGDQWDRRSWPSDNFSEQMHLRAWTCIWKREKISHISSEPLPPWVSVASSLIYVLINSKGNRKWWMKMTHAQMAETCSKTLFPTSISLLLFRRVARASVHGVSRVPVQFSRKYTHKTHSQEGRGSSPSLPAYQVISGQLHALGVSLFSSAKWGQPLF